MKTAVSIPDDVFARADALASRRGWSRSHLYTRALEDLLAREGSDSVTAALDALADELGEQETPNPGRALIAADRWQW